MMLVGAVNKSGHFRFLWLFHLWAAAMVDCLVGDYFPEWPLRYHNSQWLHKEFILPQDEDKCASSSAAVDPLGGHGHLDLNMENEPCPPCHRPSIHCERKMRKKRRQRQMATSMTVDEWLNISKEESAKKELNRQTWQYQQCHTLNETIIDEMCTTERLPVRADILKNLHLRACRRFLVERALDRDRYMLVINSTDCSGVLKELLMLDNLVEDLACEYEMVLKRYDCLEKWSVVWNCSDCRLAYRDWLCSVIIPYHQPNHGPLVKPCMSICEQVTQKCPHLHPYGKGPFAGEPVFLCIDPNIPFNKKITPEIPFGDPDQCYNVCHLEPCFNEKWEAPKLPECRENLFWPELSTITGNVDNMTTVSSTLLMSPVVTMDTGTNFEDDYGFLGESSPVFGILATNDPGATTEMSSSSTTSTTAATDDLVEGFADDDGGGGGTTVPADIGDSSQQQTSTPRWMSEYDYNDLQPLALLLPATGNSQTNSRLQFALDTIPEPLAYPAEPTTTEHRRHRSKLPLETGSSAAATTTSSTEKSKKSHELSSGGDAVATSGPINAKSKTTTTTGATSAAVKTTTAAATSTTDSGTTLDDYQTIPPTGTEPTEIEKNRKIPENSKPTADGTGSNPIGEQQQARFRHFNSRTKAELQHQQQQQQQQQQHKKRSDPKMIKMSARLERDLLASSWNGVSSSGYYFRCCWWWWWWWFEPLLIVSIRILF